MIDIKYSIIIPHKNTANLLQRCLNSIPERPDVQVIVVDDNSNPLIVDFENFPGLKRQNVEVYFLKSGKGAGHARNIGLMHAKGHWLLFADADDYYSEGFLETLNKYLTPDLDILYYNVFSDTTCDIHNRALSINKLYDEYFSSKSSYINIIKFSIWAPWNKVFSHQLIKSNNIKFDEIPVGNDAFFSLLASKFAKKVNVINEKLYCITYQEGSISYSTATYERTLLYLEINARINSFYKKNNCLPRRYRLDFLGLNYIKNLYKNYGFKKTLHCLNCIHKNTSILDLLHTLIAKKMIRQINKYQKWIKA